MIALACFHAIGLIIIITDVGGYPTVSGLP